MLDNKDFIKIGANVRDKYRTHIFTKALDVNDRKFKGYKEPYKSRKRSGKIKRQATQSANTTAPILTTDLMRDFGSVYSTSNKGFKMGWSTYGARVESLKKKGRVLTSKEKALPDGVAKFLDKEVDMAIKKKLGGNTTTIHRTKK